MMASSDMIKKSKNKALTKAQASAIKTQIAQLKAIKAAEKSLLENPPQPPENVFLQAIKGARPLNIDVPFTEKPRPQPIAKQFIRDEKQALKDSLSDDFYPAHELESGEELLYLRAGQSPDVLSKLRRGFWVVQAQIDLHGLISDEAREYVAEFLSSCKKRNIRCVRIVHGKGLGSRNREPVLKHKLRNWLMQKDEVIAYAQAKPEDGGSGAVIVLLKA